jgi:hypothetical protein
MPMDVTQIAVPFRMQPGLRRAAPGSTPLTPSLPGGRHFREKTAVLSAYADLALLADAAFDASPALAAIAAEAARAPHPAFKFDAASGDCAAPIIGWSLRAGDVRGDGDPAVGELLRALPPSQRVAALLSLAFEEDFAVIDAAACIPWLAVCLPSRWAPEDKVGKHFAEVHAPVADNAVLIAASEQLARLVTGPERWERFVWTVSADPRLHQHPAHNDAAWPVDADADRLAGQASFRHEHQSFLPVAGAGQAVFTIRVESEPLDRAIASRDAARRVHDSMASMSPAVLAYRGLETARDRLLAWLAARAASIPEPPA